MPDINRTPFSDIGIDPVIGAELFNKLDITEGDLMSSQNVNKLKDIAGFINEQPDPMFFISQMRHNNGTVSNLDFMFELVSLNRQRQDLESKLSNVNNSLKIFHE